jgi:hypothetical protein
VRGCPADLLLDVGVDIGKTLPFAQTTTAGLPAASIASSTGGSSFDCGVGRNWLSMMTATLEADATSSENRGPDVATRGRASGVCRVVDRRRLVGVDRREEVPFGDSSSSVSRETLSSSPDAPIVRGSSDS